MVQVFTVRDRITIQANPDIEPVTDLRVLPVLLPVFPTWLLSRFVLAPARLFFIYIRQ